MGSGGGSVCRAVASDARDPRFESSHRQIILSDIFLFTVRENKEKRPEHCTQGIFHHFNTSIELSSDPDLPELKIDIFANNFF